MKNRMANKTGCKEPERRLYFTFMRSWYETVRLLPDDNKGRILMGIVRYALDHEEPEFTATIDRIVWSQMKAAIDYGWKKYNAGKIGAEASKGKTGAPEGNQNAKKLPF